MTKRYWNALKHADLSVIAAEQVVFAKRRGDLDAAEYWLWLEEVHWRKFLRYR